MENHSYKELLTTVHHCMEVCNTCFDACLKEDDVKMMAQCIRIDRECADICSLLEQSITRNSPFIKDIAALCAKVCDACYEECSNHNHDHCQQCAEACKACAEACRNII